MGMFNYVNFEMPCPKCGETVRGFQTKDGDAGMHLVEIEAVTTMYAGCKCGYWIELTRAPAPVDTAVRTPPATLKEATAMGFRIVGG